MFVAPLRQKLRIYKKKRQHYSVFISAELSERKSGGFFQNVIL